MQSVRDKRDSKEITSRLLGILSVDFLDVNEFTNDAEHAAFVTRERHRMETSNGSFTPSPKFLKRSGLFLLWPQTRFFPLVCQFALQGL